MTQCNTMQRKSTVTVGPRVGCTTFSEGTCTHLAFWSQQHAAVATCKGLRIGRLQDVIWTAFPTITSNALVPAVLPHVEVA